MQSSEVLVRDLSGKATNRELAEHRFATQKRT